jgi:hypothetical protein
MRLRSAASTANGLRRLEPGSSSPLASTNLPPRPKGMHWETDERLVA